MYRPERILLLLDDIFEPSTAMTAHYMTEVLQRERYKAEVVLRGRVRDRSPRSITQTIETALEVTNSAVKDGLLAVYMFCLYVPYAVGTQDDLCTVVLTLTQNTRGVTGLFVDICDVENVPNEVVQAISREIRSVHPKFKRENELTVDEMEGSLAIVNALREGIQETPEFVPG